MLSSTVVQAGLGVKHVSERMGTGEKTETGARIVIDGSEWPKVCKAGSGVSQGDGNLTSYYRQEYKGIVKWKLKAWEVVQQQNRLLMCWTRFYRVVTG